MTNNYEYGFSLKSIALLHSESDYFLELHRTLEKFYIVHTFDYMKELQDHLAIYPESIDLTIYLCDMECERTLFKLLDSAAWKRIRTIPFWAVLESDDLTLMRYLFHNGIDEVFCLPVHIGEFLVKLDRALSRENHFEGLDLFCDLSEESFNQDDFTRTELRLLSLFVSTKGKEFTRHEIIKAIWGRKVSHHQKTLNVHLHNLRKKLKNYGYTILNTSRGEWAIVKVKIQPPMRPAALCEETVIETQFIEHHP